MEVSVPLLALNSINPGLERWRTMQSFQHGTKPSQDISQVISDFFMAHDRGSLLYDLSQLLRLGQSGYGKLKDGAPRPAEFELMEMGSVLS